ncbi:long-chain fatty acid--CoA ligase [Dactylosporangium sp. NPDC000244]|uniref:long-chain-fatty-acid--CoA ligase n=1 Tax=Dactylosporangium sp. NPDC000244 TaxID=3154365 RepID=UPI003327F337
MSFNLALILREQAARNPDRLLLHSGADSWSYRAVDTASGRLAAALRRLGLRPGDRIAVQLPNVPEFVIAYFGALRAGLVMVPLSPQLTAHELRYHLIDSQARLIITHELSVEQASEAARDIGDVPVHVVASDAAPDGVAHFDDLLTGDDESDLHPTAPEDTAVLLYSSGTTGKPKGAELTHFQLFMNCTVAGELFGIRPDDVSVAVLPLFHVFGLSMVLNLAVRYGAGLALVPRFQPDEVLDIIERLRCTVFWGVPTMYVALLRADAAGRNLSSLRAAVSGGAAIPGEVIRQFEEKFSGAIVLEGYGLSETASVATFNVSAEQRKVLSIGRAIWGVEVRIVGPDGAELPPGPRQVGEIVIRGHNVMKGYHNRPEETARAIRDGWFHTGDLGYRDEEGYFFIVDRLKDLIIRGGYNVYPREVEEVLYEHPAVAEAAVVGRPDARLGEEVTAHVVLRPGVTADSRDLHVHCRERLAGYKNPREIHIVAALPKGPTGKILKRALRQ